MNQIRYMPFSLANNMPVQNQSVLMPASQQFPQMNSYSPFMNMQPMMPVSSQLQSNQMLFSIASLLMQIFSMMSGANGQNGFSGLNFNPMTSGINNTSSGVQSANQDANNSGNSGTDANPPVKAPVKTPIKTPIKTPVQTPVKPEVDKDRPEAEKISKKFDYQNLSLKKRTEVTKLNDEERATIHLMGKAMTSEKKFDGAILNAVIASEDPKKPGKSKNEAYTDAELKLAKEMVKADKKEFGGVNGENLLRKFTGVYKKMTGIDISDRYADREKTMAKGKSFDRVSQEDFKNGFNNKDWQAAVEKQSGKSGFQIAGMTLWAHDYLDNGKGDGSILASTVQSDSKALDKWLNKDDVNTFVKADLASDGKVNGRSLENVMLDSLDQFLLGKSGATKDSVMAEATQIGKDKGLTVKQITNNITTGMKSAITSASTLIKEHPVKTAAAVGGMAVAAALCPYMAGLAVGGAGIAAAQKLMNNNQAA